jgi:hypothetical protein
VRLYPFAGAWIRAAIPLDYLKHPDRQGHDLSSLSNKPRASYWLNLIGSYGPVDAVEALGFAIEKPIGNPTVEIRSARLDATAPDDAVLESEPLVDEFGQWIHSEWPGKAKTLAELKKAWAAEEESLAPENFGYCKYGGYKNAHAKATGFFRVEKIGDRWWFVDPDGHLFFSTGADAIGSSMSTRTQGREAVFAAIPPGKLRPDSFRGGRNQVGMDSFYTWNLQRRFGEDWTQPWINFTLQRMDAWGMNTLGNWSDPRLADVQKKAYVATLGRWGMEAGYLGLPDVFAESFSNRVEAAAAEQCDSRKDDPWLLGYFIGNEPPWPGREAQIVSAILEGRPSAIQKEAKSFLAGSDTPERRREFVNGAIEKFLDTINAAIRRHDPNHLNLGLRFGSRPSDAMLRASHGFDVFSMNSYGYEVNRDNLENAYRITGKPIVIGEFHFGTPGRGLAAGLVQTRDQFERGVAYQYYMENAAAQPEMIGAHWFEWLDEPSTGRMDGENYNIGIADVTDRPYPELVEAMKATHQRLQAVHSGKEQPASRRAQAQ